MIKYASNSFLALKISYVNEVANLCESVGADVKQVSKAMGQDGRISLSFTPWSYGGSCFPKDTKEFVEIGRKMEILLELLRQLSKQTNIKN